MSKRHGHQAADKIRLDNFRKECQNAVEQATLIYIKSLGNKRALVKSHIGKFPILRVNNTFIIDCKEKAKKITQLFSAQSKPI